MKIFFASITLVFALSLNAAEIPRLTGPVVDIAGVMGNHERLVLDSGIRDYYRKTGRQFQILTIPSLEGESIEGYSIKVAENWKIGKKEGTGVIIVAAIKDRKIRIEVGGGIEGELTDAFCSRVIREFIAPQFRKGNYALGFAASMTAMSKKLGGEILFSDRNMSSAYGSSRAYQRSRRSGFSFIWLIIIFFIMRGLFFGRARGAGSGCLTGLLLGSFLGGGSRGGSGSGSFGGGWSGGGGGFSGGGASGGW